MRGSVPCNFDISSGEDSTDKKEASDIAFGDRIKGESRKFFSLKILVLSDNFLNTFGKSG